jgi:hypothetical protein
MPELYEMRSGQRGATLLLEHCEVLERLAEVRVSARARLEAALGDDLTRLLVGALSTSDRPTMSDDLLDGSAA